MHLLVTWCQNARYAREPSGGQQAERITQLKPPGGLDFDSTDLSHTWKRWSEEIHLYMDLAMEGRDKKVKVKMLLGSKGREIYETLHFEKARDGRTLQDVMNAFEEHCNPKKHETLERYKFFTRIQEGESIEKFVTDLKLLAATCNFGTLHDSLISDRIICRIRNSTLCEELLKVVDLDLDKCLRACRMSELSKSEIKRLKLLNR